MTINTHTSTKAAGTSSGGPAGSLTNQSDSSASPTPHRPSVYNPPVHDTHPEIERKRIEMLRRLTPSQRAQLGSALSNQARWRAFRAIETTHPELTDIERKLLFVQLHYGKDLADRVRRYLSERSS